MSGENSVRGDGLDVFIGTDKPITVRVYGQDRRPSSRPRPPGSQKIVERGRWRG